MTARVCFPFQPTPCQTVHSYKFPKGSPIFQLGRRITSFALSSAPIHCEHIFMPKRSPAKGRCLVASRERTLADFFRLNSFSSKGPLGNTEVGWQEGLRPEDVFTKKNVRLRAGWPGGTGTLTPTSDPLIDG